MNRLLTRGGRRGSPDPGRPSRFARAVPRTGGLVCGDAAVWDQKAADLVHFSHKNVPFCAGGPVAPLGRGGRNVGPLGRNTRVLRCFRLFRRDRGDGIGSRQMGADGRRW